MNVKTIYFDWQTDLKLYQLLKKSGICNTKTEAIELIEYGTVLVNSFQEDDPYSSVLSGDLVEFDWIKIKVE